MENIFYMIVSFCCMVFLIDHFTTIMAHHRFKGIENLRNSVRWYLAVLCIVGTFLYLFIIVKTSKLFLSIFSLGQGAIPAYTMFSIGAVLLIFVIKYSTYIENREKEKLAQIED